MKTDRESKILSKEYGRCGSWNSRGIRKEGDQGKLIGKKGRRNQGWRRKKYFNGNHVRKLKCAPTLGYRR